MRYLTVKEASKKWGVSTRWVQLCCSLGLIEGVVRFNRNWMIPYTAIKPQITGTVVKERPFLEEPILMASSWFSVEQTEQIIKMEQEKEMKQEMLAEYAYFSGDFERAIAICSDITIDKKTWLASRMIYSVASMSVGDFDRFEAIRKELLDMKKEYQGNNVVSAQITLALTLSAIAIYDIKASQKEMSNRILECLPLEARSMYVYFYAKYQQMKADSEAMYIAARTALTYSKQNEYNVIDLYLILMCAISCQELGREKEAYEYIKRALDVALPHGFIVMFSEHLVALHGMVETCLQEYPEYYERVISVYEDTWKNWIIIHNKCTKDNITMVLTYKEQQIAQLAAEGKTNVQIAECMHLSVSTIKASLQIIYEKLFIRSRTELKKYIMMTK